MERCRKLHVREHIVYSIVGDQTVSITRMLHASQDPTDMFG